LYIHAKAAGVFNVKIRVLSNAAYVRLGLNRINLSDDESKNTYFKMKPSLQM